MALCNPDHYMLALSTFAAGLITRQEGDIQGSMELFQKAVRLNPNNAANIKQVARSRYIALIQQ